MEPEEQVWCAPRDPLVRLHPGAEHFHVWQDSSWPRCFGRNLLRYAYGYRYSLRGLEKRGFHSKGEWVRPRLDILFKLEFVRKILDLNIAS